MVEIRRNYIIICFNMSLASSPPEKVSQVKSFYSCESSFSSISFSADLTSIFFSWTLKLKIPFNLLYIALTTGICSLLDEDILPLPPCLGPSWNQLSPPPNTYYYKCIFTINNHCFCHLDYVIPFSFLYFISV